MLVRSAVPADAEAVAAVHVASWQGAYRGVFPDEVLDGPELPASRLRGWRRLLDEPDPGTVDLVAEVEDRIVGLLHAGPAQDEDVGPSTAQIMMIYAAPDAWGTGAGRGLMTAGLERLRSAGYADVILWVLESNSRARRFYERAGFAADGATQDEDMAGTTIREVRYRRSV